MESSCCHLPQFRSYGDLVTYSTSSSCFFASSRPISFQSIFCNGNSLIRSSPHRYQHQHRHRHHHHHSLRHHRYKLSICADHVSPRAVSNEEQQTCISSGQEALVGIIMGSDSDLPVMKAAAELLETFNVAYELTVVSAHRTPERMVEYATSAHIRGIKVIIAGAGGAAHLPGMVAAMTPLPVIGVPVRGLSLDGLDSLLSIVQMPRGVPVATVAINNAMNAGLLAVRILGSSDVNLRNKVLVHQNNMKSTVLEKAERLEEVGWQAYS